MTRHQEMDTSILTQAQYDGRLEEIVICPFLKAYTMCPPRSDSKGVSPS